MYEIGEHLQVQETNGIKLITTVITSGDEPTVVTVGKMKRILYPKQFTIVRKMTKDEVDELYKRGK